MGSPPAPSVPPQICHPPPLPPARGSLWQLLHRTSLVHPEVPGGGLGVLGGPQKCGGVPQ